MYTCTLHLKERQKQEDREFEDSLDYITRSCLKNKNKNQQGHLSLLLASTQKHGALDIVGVQ
jgi:hypothetical protein